MQARKVSPGHLVFLCMHKGPLLAFLDGAPRAAHSHVYSRLQTQYLLYGNGCKFTLWHSPGDLMWGSDLPGLEVSVTWMICQCECVASSACALKKAPTSAPAELMGVKLWRRSFSPRAAQNKWLGGVSTG